MEDRCGVSGVDRPFFEGDGGVVPPFISGSDPGPLSQVRSAELMWSVCTLFIQCGCASFWAERLQHTIAGSLHHGIDQNV